MSLLEQAKVTKTPTLKEVQLKKNEMTMKVVKNDYVTNLEQGDWLSKASRDHATGD